MKTKYKHIHFVEVGDAWQCRNACVQNVLCWVTYDKEWKQWVTSYTDQHAVFSISCLRDVADFLDQLNAQGAPR